uniref:Uncharacterized protein n=1 Tax=Anthurium amnicola TaxID=1678845 RepID=A0A1D1Z0F7_9ARAE
MDLETENHLAALLMEEARRLRLQADKEGVGAYIRQPKVRGRPNSRFLTATVLGVQQANRAVEVNEMWRAREKELELDDKLSYRSKGTPRQAGERCQTGLSKESDSWKHRKTAPNASVSPSSSKERHKNFHLYEDDGLHDEEIEEFLQSRTKRGRGAVGSRMDEPGPYPVCTSSDRDEQLINHEVRAQDEWKRQILGPEKPSWLLTRKHEEDSFIRNTKEDDTSRSKKRLHSKEKHTSEKSDRSRREEKPRHHHRS